MINLDLYYFVRANIDRRLRGDRRQGEKMARSLVDTKIIHETFGSGVVIAEEARDGREALVRIAFENDDRPWRQFQKRDISNDDGPFRKA
jgi:hypothetical protein